MSSVYRTGVRSSRLVRVPELCSTVQRRDVCISPLLRSTAERFEPEEEGGGGTGALRTRPLLFSVRHPPFGILSEISMTFSSRVSLNKIRFTCRSEDS